MIRVAYQGEWMWLPQKTVCGLLHNGQSVYLDVDPETMIEIDKTLERVGYLIYICEVGIPMIVERNVEGGTFVRSLGFVYYAYKTK